MISLPTVFPAAALVAWMLALTLKHVVADFFLQTAWMAEGKERRVDWLKPLLAHTGIHAGILLAMLLVAAPQFWWLALVDFVVHTIIDRCKSLVVSGFGLKPNQAYFWWAIGIDQALHHLTDFVFALVLAAG